jgi:CRISPR/Cas system-associated protein Cas10 (large subunit of type III CRISPR-Cas system)
MKPDFEIQVSCNKCQTAPEAKFFWIGIDKILEQDFSEFQDEEGKCLICGHERFIVRHWRDDLELFNGASPSLENAIIIAEILEEIDRKDIDEVAVEAFLKNWQLNQFEIFDDIYIGEQTLLEYATALLPELYEIPSKLDMFIDYRKFARELEIDILEINIHNRYFLFYLNF